MKLRWSDIRVGDAYRIALRGEVFFIVVLKAESHSIEYLWHRDSDIDGEGSGTLVIHRHEISTDEDVFPGWKTTRVGDEP